MQLVNGTATLREKNLNEMIVMISEKRLKKANPFAVISFISMLLIDLSVFIRLPAEVIICVCPIIGIISNVIIIDLLRSYKNIYVFSIIQIVCYGLVFSFLFFYDSELFFVTALVGMFVGTITSIRVLYLIDL